MKIPERAIFWAYLETVFVIGAPENLWSDALPDTANNPDGIRTHDPLTMSSGLLHWAMAAPNIKIHYWNINVFVIALYSCNILVFAQPLYMKTAYLHTIFISCSNHLLIDRCWISVNHPTIYTNSIHQVISTNLGSRSHPSFIYVTMERNPSS